MKRVYAKPENCRACHHCEVFCRITHSQPDDFDKALRSGAPYPLARTQVEEKKLLSFSVSCHHCDEPPCVYACIAGALQKDPVSGVVTVDTEKCVGCWTCILVCPYGAIHQDKYEGKIVKCDLCQGQLMPMCVSSCSYEALVYGETDN